MSHKKKEALAPIIIRRAAGCVVYRIEDGQPQFLLICDPYGRWTLPKGHLERDETAADAAIREVLEETGVHGQLGPLVEMISYRFNHRGRMIDKQVTFFLMQADAGDVRPQVSEGISAVAWYPAEEAFMLINYAQVRGVFQKALAML